MFSRLISILVLWSLYIMDNVLLHVEEMQDFIS